jgi:hypothetical protein
MGGSRRRNRRRRAVRRLVARLAKEEQCKLHPEPNRFFLTFNEKGLIVNATQTCVGDITHVLYTGHADVYNKHHQTSYSGGVVNGLYSGEGNSTYSSYSDVGTFTEGALNGTGERFVNGKLLYKGDFVKGVYHGEGTYVYLNGDRYEGSFKDGLRHGRGTRYFNDGTTVTGTWDRSFYSRGDYKGWYSYLI